jgi:hypothetical protein
MTTRLDAVWRFFVPSRPAHRSSRSLLGIRILRALASITPGRPLVLDGNIARPLARRSPARALFTSSPWLTTLVLILSSGLARSWRSGVSTGTTLHGWFLAPLLLTTLALGHVSRVSTRISLPLTGPCIFTGDAFLRRPR